MGDLYGCTSAELLMRSDLLTVAHMLQAPNAEQIAFSHGTLYLVSEEASKTSCCFFSFTSFYTGTVYCSTQVH